MKEKRKVVYIILILLFFTSCGKVKRRPNYKISKHFTFHEAIGSNKGKAWHLRNYPSKKNYKNIVYTARRMEKIRKIIGKNLIINSWYRSGNINRLVGGSSSSAHKDGLAVDFKIKGKGSLSKALRKIKKSGYSYDQIIYHSKSNYIHISFRRNKRKERKKIYYR